MGPVRTLAITSLDPTTATAEQLEPVLAATHAARTASASVDLPFEPPATAAVWRARVIASSSGDPLRQLVATDTDGRTLGHAMVELPMHDNLHLGLVELHV